MKSLSDICELLCPGVKARNANAFKRDPERCAHGLLNCDSPMCKPAPNSAHPVTADRFARYEAALREIATIMPSAAGAIAENALKDDGVIL